MDRHALRTTLTGLLSETTGETYGELQDGQGLVEGLGLDSVDIFTLVVDIQNEFGIKIASEELTTVATVGDLLDLVGRKTGGRAGGASAAA